MSHRQCRRIYEKRVLEFDKNEIEVKNLNAISGQVGMFGTARKSDGWCWNAPQAFDLDGVHYPDNYAYVTITGTVTRRKVKYNPSVNKVKLEDRSISLSRGHYEGQLDSFYWQIPHLECENKLQQIYAGTATFVNPKNPMGKNQVLVRDEKRSLSFALELHKGKDICGSKLYSTQLSNIYVAISTDNFLRQVEETTHVDRIDNLLG